MNYRYNKKHLYKTWKAMNRRCNNPEDNNYKNYGERGITVCNEWLDSNPQGLDNFHRDMGDKPHDVTLDRIDNNKGYTKDNCRWATVTEQANNKRSNRMLNYNGVEMSLSLLAEHKGIIPNTLCYRLRRGWSLAEAVGDIERESEEYLGTLSLEQRNQVKSLNEQGLSSCAIARELGVSQWVVYSYSRTLDEVNLDIVGFDGSIVKLSKKFSSTIDQLHIMMDLLDKGYTRQAVSKELGVSGATITNWIKMLGGEVRKHPPRNINRCNDGN